MFVEAMQRLESIADDDTMRWHELLRILMGWVTQRRRDQDRNPLFTLAVESQRTQAHKREVEMERATMEQTWVEKMAIQLEERIRKEVTEQMQKEAAIKQKELADQQRKELADQRKELADQQQKEMANQQLATSRELLLGILTDRYGTLPASLVGSVEACADLDRLRAAVRKAASSASLDQFQL